MPQPIDLLYGTAVTALSFNGLTDGSAMQSDFIDNTTDLFVDFIVQLTVDFPNTAPTGGIILYLSSSLDGTDFSGTGVTGTEGTYTSGDFNNLYYYLDVDPTQNETSSASANFTWWLGWVPPFFSFVVRNSSGETLGLGSVVTVTGVKVQTS